MINLEQLMESAKQGNSEAFQKLFSQYQPVVFGMKKKYFLKDYDVDDWLQEGRIVFLQVLRRYETNRGVTLGKFYKLAFCNHVLSLLRKQAALKRRTQLLCSSLEALKEAGASCGEQVDNQPLAIEHLLLREGFSKYESLFSKLERQVMDRYLLGYDFVVIEKQLNISEKKARSAFDRAKRKLSKYLQENSRDY